MRNWKSKRKSSCTGNDTSSNAFYAVLVGLIEEIEAETDQLKAVYDRMASSLNGNDDLAKLVVCTALGSMVSKIYTKSEDVFSKIARKIDSDFPSGDSLHTDLLFQMKTANDVRPPFLSPESFDLFDQLRRFRHVERNSYSSALDPKLIPSKVELLLNARDHLRRDFDAFVQYYFGIQSSSRPPGSSPRSS